MPVRMQKQVFLPEPARSPANNIWLLLGFVLVVTLVVEDGWAGRLLFFAFAGVFLALYLLFVRREAARNLHPLQLDADGLHYAPLATGIGKGCVPWPEMARLDIFYGSNGPGIPGPGPGPRWLRIYLQDGPFRRQVHAAGGKMPFSGNLNILMDFTADPEAILEAARRFQAHYGKGG